MKRAIFWIASAIAFIVLIAIMPIMLDTSQPEIPAAGKVTHVQYRTDSDNAVRFTLDTVPGKIFSCPFEECGMIKDGDVIGITYNTPSIWNSQTDEVQYLKFNK